MACTCVVILGPYSDHEEVGKVKVKEREKVFVGERGGRGKRSECGEKEYLKYKCMREVKSLR